ncbi:thioesterase domain-containing protein [Actinomadura fulvescens]|uniref:Thioesterase domain-containing protein n=1 Tax=Actinomadura fulvescens TaxID=46160 RepID=A0ABP6CBU8_9ACTN
MSQHDAGRTVLRTLSGEPGAGRRICVVHPGTLPVQVYRELAGRLAPSAALDVLEMSRLPAYRAAMAAHRPDITVESLAADLAAHLDGARHDLVAGWSFGGLVALALAGGAAPVALLDSVASWQDDSLSGRAVRPYQTVTWFCMFLGARTGRAFTVEPDRLRGALDPVLAYVRERGIEQRVLPAEMTVGWLHDLFVGFVRQVRRNGRMAEAFRPGRVPDPLLLIKPRGSLFPGASSLGWTALAGDALRLVPGPGDHYSMLTDPVAVAHTAAVFRSVLDRPVLDRQGQIP